VRALSEAAASALDLELAWRRVKFDRPDRCFISHPHLLHWIEQDLEGWIRHIQAELLSGYVPRPALRCLEPKEKALVRPGAVLDVVDEVVYNAVVGACYTPFLIHIGSAQGDPDVAYQLRHSDRTVAWLKRGFPVWTEWRLTSLQRLDSGALFVVVSDIAGCYENIDLHRLRSDIRLPAIRDDLLDLLMDCLNRWAHPRGKGIPQGYSASDILAKMYLAPLDEGLRNAGFDHLRYVDDLRIFCSTLRQAKQALLLLAELLADRGLNVQTAKTEILDGAIARTRIDGLAPLVETVDREVREELERAADALGPYATATDVEEIISRAGPRATVTALERTFRDHFIAAGVTFNKTLLHYLLNRLGTQKSPVAVGYAIDLLRTRPEETVPALRYLATPGLVGDVESDVLQYALSDDAIYDHQIFRIAEWFWHRGILRSPLLAAARQWAFDRNRDPWLRSYALAILGAAGNRADLERVETSYGEATSDVERADIVAALKRMEVGRRNAFFGRVRGDGELVRRAIAAAQAAKSLS